MLIVFIVKPILGQHRIDMTGPDRGNAPDQGLRGEESLKSQK